MAIMTVPETSMGKENRPVSWKNDIGLSWQGALMEPEPETCRVQSASQYEFRFGVFTPDARHHPATHFRGNDVRHELLPLASRGASP